jgi:DNA polymerase-3 subunit epsilon
VQHLTLERPLVFFDLETTGTDPASDRIVEISVLRVEPDGSRESRTRRINPGRPIPAEATAVHGIRDEDVRDEPFFRQLARGLLEFLAGADLAGFNVTRFDIPLLEREFRDCGLDLGLAQRRVVDAMTIFHRMERRDLGAAVEFYLGREHSGAHAAEADVLATAEVLDAQLARYAELPRSVDGLDGWMRPGGEDAVDRSGKFRWQGGEVVFAFGKHQGRALREVAAESSGYLEWIVKSDFPSDAKALVDEALQGRFPERSDQSR